MTQTMALVLTIYGGFMVAFAATSMEAAGGASLLICSLAIVGSLLLLCGGFVGLRQFDNQCWLMMFMGVVGGAVIYEALLGIFLFVEVDIVDTKSKFLGVPDADFFGKAMALLVIISLCQLLAVYFGFKHYTALVDLTEAVAQAKAAEKKKKDDGDGDEGTPLLKA